MVADIEKFAKLCQQCQKHGKTPAVGTGLVSHGNGSM